MREEQDVGEFERLVNVSMGHELLVCEALVCTILLIPCVDLGGDELRRFSDNFRNNAFVVLDQVVEDTTSLKRRCDHLAKCIRVAIANLVAKFAFTRLVD